MTFDRELSPEDRARYVACLAAIHRSWTVDAPGDVDAAEEACRPVVESFPSRQTAAVAAAA